MIKSDQSPTLLGCPRESQPAGATEPRNRGQHTCGSIFRHLFSHIILMLALFLFDIVNGQVLSPVLSGRTFEVGIQYKRFHRNLSQEFPLESDWGYLTGFVRYGLNSYITLSLEGTAHNFYNKEWPDRDYRLYSIGAGITTCIFATSGFDVGVSFHYNEALFFDRSESRYHHNVRNIVGAVRVERAFVISNQSVTVGILPAYIYDEDTMYPYGSHVVDLRKSYNNLGIVATADIFLFDRAHLFCHIVYADYFQPRIGLAFQM